jgi:hypothetical protein
MDLVAKAARGTATKFRAVSLDGALQARRDLSERRNEAWTAVGASR